MTDLRKKLATVQAQEQETQEKIMLLRNQLPQLEASLYGLQGQRLLLNEMIQEEVAAAAKQKEDEKKKEEEKKNE